jgi:hypothetical protein
VNSVISAGAGFLLAVLWFDLMFDVQVLHRGEAEPPQSALKSIAKYYRRVTTDARPMNRLVPVAMLATLVGVALQLIRDDAPRWVSAISAVSAMIPIGLAISRTVPSASRLGTRRDPLATQATLARSILRDHLVCVALITALLVTQLGWG